MCIKQEKENKNESYGTCGTKTSFLNLQGRYEICVMYQYPSWKKYEVNYQFCVNILFSVY